MIDIHAKPATDREAIAVGRVHMSSDAVHALATGTLPKGDALAAARIAGIMAAKRTPDIIPLCHQIAITYIGVEFSIDESAGDVGITTTARAHASTGVEMEALAAVAAAALTIHDMCKALDPGIEIREIHLQRKSGGKAGVWERRDVARSSHPIGRILAVSLSAGKGTRKTPVEVGVLREDYGLVGDAHAGTGRQVSLLANESVDTMRAEGMDLHPGDFAENLTTSGIRIDTLPVGTRLRVGENAMLEVTQIGKECHQDCEIRAQTGRCVMPTEGVFAKVLVGGEVRRGDIVEVVGP
ncbi:MAG: cyclic pyranopterin monophosphate synthase MoaC [Armatimonadota bacterium]